jgi:periplasmic protein TonB
VRILLLRPSILASVALHGAALWTTFHLAGPAPSDRRATLVGFEPLELAGPADAMAAEPPAEAPRLEEGAVVSAAELPLDPLPPDALPPIEDAPVPVEPPPLADRASERAPSIVPMLTVATAVPTRVRRAPTSSAATGPTSVSMPSPSPSPSPSRVASAPSARGSSGITSVSHERPTNRRPAYPTSALRNRWEGTAWLVVEILENGRVGHVTLEQSSGYEILDGAAIDAVRDWTYEPALSDGVPVRDLIRMPFRWQVSDRGA